MNRKTSRHIFFVRIALLISISIYLLSAVEATAAPGDFTLEASPPFPLTCVASDPSTALVYSQQNLGTWFGAYNPNTDMGTTLTSCPISSGNNGGAAYLNGKIYTVYAENSTSMGVYDIAGDSWSTIPNGLGSGTGVITAAYPYLYLAISSTFKRYDTVSGTWTDLATPPFSFDACGGMEYWRGTIYAHQGGGYTQFAKYDVSSETWTTLTNVPGGAVLGSAIDPVGKVYYTYGSYSGTNWYAFDLETETWSTDTIPFFSVGDGGMSHVWQAGVSGIYFVQGESGTGHARMETVPADDRFEENDSISEAPAVSPGTYDALDCADGDQDFYSITFSENSTFDVSIQFAHVSGDLDLYIYDSSQKMIESSVSTTDDETVTLENVIAGTLYYVEVIAYGTGTSNDYRMIISDTAASHTWKEAGSLNEQHYTHTSTLLPNGKVLVAGGYGVGGIPLSCAELYDPATDTWSATGYLNQAHWFHTATLLPNGKVLVAGGVGTGNCELFDSSANGGAGGWTTTASMSTSRIYHTATLLPNGKVLVAGGNGGGNTCELYDPSANDGAGEWTLTASMSTPRSLHTATLLTNGKVFVAGGSTSGGLTSCELYDPSANDGFGGWTTTNASMSTGRYIHTATLLPDGKVLVAGGGVGGYLTSCEIYDPSANDGTGGWTTTDSLHFARGVHTATLLPDGKVLVAGGGTGSFPSYDSFDSCELYDPVSETWSLIDSLNAPRYRHTTTLLSNGQVLVAGGAFTLNTERYNPATGNWALTTDDLNTTRSGHTAMLLPDGKVLVVGGYGNVTSCELYDPDTDIWTFTASLTSGRDNHTATLLPDGKVLVAGGNGSGGHLTSCELFDPSANGGTGGWTTTASLITGRSYHTATLLPDGRVLVAGGRDASGSLTSCAIFDPSANSGTGGWTTTGSMSTGRREHTSTLLYNGKVLVAGGKDDIDGNLKSCELFDPTSNTWFAASDFTVNRLRHTTTLLPDGRVLMAGGCWLDYVQVTHRTVEIYSPATDTWSVTGDLIQGRHSHSATLLPNGRIIVAGGSFESFADPLSYLDSCEMYDPASGTWSNIDNLNVVRYDHTATLLPDGNVLVTGGDDGDYYLTSCELYNPGLGYDPAWRPGLDPFASVLEVGNTLQITGSGFLGISEASGGNGTQDSSTNHPIAKIRSIENEQTLWLQLDSASGFSDTEFNALPFANFPDGLAMVTVFTNGIPSESETIQVHNHPSVISIVRANASPTNAVNVNFTVTFNKPVTGVDASDFIVSESGLLTTSTVSSVTPTIPTNNFVYTVTVDSYTGQGTLGLDVVDDDSIVEDGGLGFVLGGTGTGNGDYTGDETYDIDRVAPFLAYINVWTGRDIYVTFSEDMGPEALTLANYTISGDGINPTGHGTLPANPDEVVHLADNTYRLSWDEEYLGQYREMRNGYDVTITVSGMLDSVGNPIGTPDSQTHDNGGIGVGPDASATPPGGTYITTQLVALLCDDGMEGSGCAEIYYTTDGSTPTTASSGFLSDISIGATTVLKFFAVDNAGNEGNIETEIYDFQIPTDITCVLSEGSITLGAGINVSGTITPSPPPMTSGLYIKLLPPGISDPDDSSVNTIPVEYDGSTFEKDIACDEFNEAGTWHVMTKWIGDSSYLGDESDPLSSPLSVAQAATSLTLDIVASETIKINGEPPIGGKLTPTPVCSTGDLSGLTVTLTLTDPPDLPDNSDVILTTTNQNGQFELDFDSSGFVFNETGPWTIQASFSGTTDYLSADPVPIDVQVVPTAGYAVIVEGMISSEEGLLSHNKTTKFVNKTLLERQLLPDDIEYLSWIPGTEGRDDWPTKAKVQTALTVSKARMIADAGDLYIIMTDHGWTQGDDGVFYLDDETITSSELAGWLDTLQYGDDAVIDPGMEDRKIVLILGFCRAGKFIEHVAGPNRVVIASAAADEASHRGPKDVDDDGDILRDGEYFVTEFFKSMSKGKSVSDGFKEATRLVEKYTTSGSGEINAPYFDDSVQHPILDDNEDGQGSNALSGAQGEDGYNSKLLYIGTSPPATNEPGDVLVTKVCDPRFLGITEDAVDLWAEVDDSLEVRLIWVEVKEPNYDPGVPVQYIQTEMDTYKDATTTYNGAEERYEWNGLDGGTERPDLFDTPGSYQVFYFVKDDSTGNTSQIVEGKVYKARPDAWGDFTAANEPPDEFGLLSPANGTLGVYTTVVLDWEDTTDPDGDNLTYRVILSKGSECFDETCTDRIVIEDVKYSTCLAVLPEYEWDDSDVYWKVQAIDEYGAVRDSGLAGVADSDVRYFHTDNNNPPLGGWIEGHVVDNTSPDAASIDNAEVNITGIPTIYTALGGYYLGVIDEAGIYSVSADSIGFDDETHADISIFEGVLITRDFELYANADDTDGDGLKDYDELYTCAYEVAYDDADSDDDGIADGDEDADKDGVVDGDETDPGDADTDNDGIQDGTEQGITTGVADPDGAGPLLGTEPVDFQPDLDPSTTTDPLDDDTDDDGTIDGGPTGEDKNSNGRLDAGETDPNPIDSIPTLNEWGMIVFFIFLIGSALLVLRKRRKEDFNVF